MIYKILEKSKSTKVRKLVVIFVTDFDEQILIDHLKIAVVLCVLGFVKLINLVTLRTTLGFSIILFP